jgi:2,3,4,5-tetrahydropyridine-2-carboxylate N-succinyltransferase
MIAEPDTQQTPQPAVVPESLLADLAAGRLRAARPDPSAPGGWQVDPTIKTAILGLFADRRMRDWQVGPFRYRDRVGLPLADLDGEQRIVPGGTSIRAGSYLAPDVVVLPPSYVNVGAWIGERTMVDSHVLVGSCAQIGADVHLAAGVRIGGVLEPPGARPVIVEDEAFVGAGAVLLDGVLIGRRAVIGAGVTLGATSRVYDLVRERVLQGTVEEPLAIPPDAVVVPGARRVPGSFAADHGLGVAVALIVKDRDGRTDARTALAGVLR